jgi:uncharacterized protein
MRICAQCATRGSTCCCVNRDILVTRRDIERIVRVVGQRNFFEYRQPIDPGYLDQDDDPNWLRYTMHPEGTRRVLKHGENKACHFVTSTGCVLPLKARPLVCRLYPFMYNERGLTGVLSECPEHLLSDNETILDALHMSYDEARVWRDRLYAELRAEDRDKAC